MLTPEQCKAARAIIGWSQSQLAAQAHVGFSTVRDFEKGRHTPHHNNLKAIKETLEAGGVEFIPGNGGEPGVRPRK